MNFQSGLRLFLACLCLYPFGAVGGDKSIDRKAWVTRHNPVATHIDPQSPFTVGNGHFAMTADVTGLQSLPDVYFENGIPLETKARWAWHSRDNPQHYRLRDTDVVYSAYGRKVAFPTDMESAAGQWLRRNPHDLPLARIGLTLDGKPLSGADVAGVDQRLDMWQGLLESRYTLDGEAVAVHTFVHGERDIVAVSIVSKLLDSGRLGVTLAFPRGYLAEPKNTPRIDWSNDHEHTTQFIEKTQNYVLFLRQVDDHRHQVRVAWAGSASLVQTSTHTWRLAKSPSDEPGGDNRLEFSVEFIAAEKQPGASLSLKQIRSSSRRAWERFWRAGAAIDFSGSRDPRAAELERRIVLSQYLMAVQSRADIPSQETGLTSSSWYGKHHTEMAWWHTAHWILWGRSENAERVLDWYVATLDEARKTARERGLEGARWSKMVGPEGRESPGGNPLIIWNQPQVIHLAEMLYQSNRDPKILQRYSSLVEETAQALSSMLTWDEEGKRYSLEPPIWISQEIYAPGTVRNPGFELSYWRYGLDTAQRWRKRLGKEENTKWNQQLDRLAALPMADGKYVAVESIPDTFENIASREDHPTLLAPLGLLDDETVDPAAMKRTLHAVLESWNWKAKIWGWDYPMIAMTALRLGEPETALDVLLGDYPNNHYLANGHCPQRGAGLPVYLPANGAFLAATAMLVGYFETGGSDGEWKVRAEGFPAPP